jgi:hypothetical protein
VFVGIADHPRDSGQRGHFFGSALRVASRDNDFTAGVLPPNSTDGGAGVLIGRSRYGASIQDHQGRGCCRGGAIESAHLKLAINCRAIRLGRAAAKVFYVESRHRFMITQ